MSVLAPSLFETALEAAPDAIIIVDGSGRIVYVNGSAEVLFRYSAAELNGTTIERLVPQQWRAEHRALRTGFFAAPRTRPMGQALDLRALRSDGSEVAIEISLSPFCGAERTFVIAAIRDVSERKRAELQLGTARAAAEQARESACVARDLAERANRTKSRFLATASHDLRQPLQTLALLNGTLRCTARDPAAADALAQQERAISAMTRLVNALLDIGKFEAGAVRPQISEFAARPMLESLREEFGPLAVQKGLTLRFEVQAGSLRTDPALLEQVLRNLLSNALKYTVRGEILLRCEFEPPLAHIEVRDSGIGIPEVQLSQIFTEFFQVDTSAGVPRSGYGLGLSIVSRIIELLGLKLKVQSSPGAGSRFQLTVPAGSGAVAPAGAIEAAPPEPTPFSSTPRILLIEDEASVRRATELLLRASGYEVYAGASEQEALAVLDGHPQIDLLISDYHLAGEVTGTQVIDTVRARLGTQVPAILLSGDTSSSVQAPPHDARWRTARKPLRAEELLGLIGTLLGR